MSKTLKIALVSDIHAHTKNAGDVNAPSYLGISSPPDDPTNNPITGLKRLIKEHDLEADALLCAGDMGDKADPGAQVFIWQQLQDLRIAFHADFLAATAGNHDVDSRYAYNDYDAKGMLQSLEPMYPGLGAVDCDKYWSRNFVIVEFEEWRLLLLNSSAYHGGGHNAEEEYQHGRVSQKTIEAIKVELASCDDKFLNILLCHHHPLRNDDIPIEDYSEMMGGDLLLNLLGSGEFGNWIIIHGHKHYPEIGLAPGSVTAPWILSAGSLSAKLYPELATKVRNQFYLLSFPISKIETLKMGVLGSIKVWDWIYGTGWQPAGMNSGIPHRAGFGCRTHTDALADTIASSISTSTEPWVEWDEIIDQQPELEFVSPNDLRQLLQKIGSKHDITVNYHGDGFPHQLMVLV